MRLLRPRNFASTGLPFLQVLREEIRALSLTVGKIQANFVVAYVNPEIPATTHADIDLKRRPLRRQTEPLHFHFIVQGWRVLLIHNPRRSIQIEAARVQRLVHPPLNITIVDPPYQQPVSLFPSKCNLPRGAYTHCGSCFTTRTLINGSSPTMRRGLLPTIQRRLPPRSPCINSPFPSRL